MRTGSSSSSSSSSSSTTAQTFLTLSDFLTLYERPHLAPENQALLLHLELQCAELFQRCGHPSQNWIAEILTLAITRDSDRYRRLLNHYLTFLERTPIIEHSHLKGLADLLTLGSVWHPHSLTSDRLEQLLQALENKTSLYHTEGLTLVDRHRVVLLWQQLCFSLEATQLPFPEDKKARLQNVLKKHKKAFRRKEDPAGVSLVQVTEQSLLRTHPEISPSISAARYLGTALFHGATATVSAGLTPLTGGISALDAITGAKAMIANLAGMVTTVARAIKDGLKKKDWYLTWRDLQAALLSCAYHTKPDLFNTLQQALLASQDPEQNRLFAHTLLDTLVQIATSLPEKDYHDYHVGIFKLLTHYYAIPDKTLKARILDAFIRVARALQNDAFYSEMVKLLGKDPGEYASLPVAADHVENLVWLYRWCDHQKSQNPELGQLQAGLLTRLSTQYPNHPSLIADVLVSLERESRAIQTQITSLQAQYHHRAAEIDSARERQAHTPQRLPPLLLTAWFQLSTDQQNAFRVLCGINPVASPHAPVPSAPGDYLFGRVRRLVIGSVNERGAIQINYPRAGQAGAAEFINQLDFQRLQQVAQQQGEEKGEPTRGLAADVGVSFIGHYNRGISVGIPQEVIDHAMTLAREWGQEEFLGDDQKMASAPSVSALAPRLGSPIHSSARSATLENATPAPSSSPGNV